MKLFIFRDGICDPAKNLGLCKLFNASVDLDAFLAFFANSIGPTFVNKYRAFITDDSVEWDAMDHFVLFGEPLGIITKWSGKIKEVNLNELRST